MGCLYPDWPGLMQSGILFLEALHSNEPPRWLYIALCACDRWTFESIDKTNNSEVDEGMALFSAETFFSRMVLLSGNHPPGVGRALQLAKVGGENRLAGDFGFLVCSAAT